MDKWDLPLSSLKLQKALEGLGADRIKAMLIVGERSADFIKERVDYFNLNPAPLGWPGFRLYLSRDGSKGSPFDGGSEPATGR